MKRWDSITLWTTWAGAPARSWYLQFSSFIFIRQSLDLPPNIPVKSAPLRGWYFPTVQPNALLMFCISLKKPEGGLDEHERGWKKCPGSRDITCYSWFKGKPPYNAGARCPLLTSASRRCHGRLWVCKQAPPPPLKDNYVCKWRLMLGLLTDVKCVPFPPSITVASELEPDRRPFLPWHNEPVSSRKPRYVTASLFSIATAWSERCWCDHSVIVKMNTSAT